VMEPPIREGSPVSSDPPPPVLDGRLHLRLGDFTSDDLSGYRRREATWASIAVHVVLVLLLLFVPKWTPKGPVLVPVQPKDDTTFLDLPRAPVTVKPPKTDIISDQNRVAQSRTPVPNKETLRKLLDEQRPGPPKVVNPPPQPAQQQQQVVQAQPAPQPQQGTQSVPAQPQDSAKLQAPPQPKQNPFAIASAGSSVDQAIRNAANNPVHSSTSFGSGHYGSGLRP